MVKIVNRLASMFLDHIVMSLILVPLMIGFMVIIQLCFKESYPDAFFINQRISYSVLLLPFLVYFLKDSYRGKSVGKRLIGLQVINKKSGKPANSLQCFIRNLFIVIWPLEVIISIFSPERRLGDLFANTKVLDSEKETAQSIFKEVKNTTFSVNSLYILIGWIIYSYLLSYLLVSLN